MAGAAHTPTPTGGAAVSAPPLADVAEALRVLVVAGIPVGVLVAGLGSRLAMFVIRATSPPTVVGLVSDDGFVIGRVTVAGTYNLLLIGAVVGVIGAAAYRLVAPWLLGPGWLRRATVAVAAAGVVGSALIRDEGIDFTVLRPVELSVALFVLLPALFGLAIGPAVDSVARPGSRTAQGRARWLVPIGLVVAFPFVVVPLALIALAMVLWRPFAGTDVVRVLRGSPWFGLAVRGAWLAVAVAGLLALRNDVTAVL